MNKPKDRIMKDSQKSTKDATASDVEAIVMLLWKTGKALWRSALDNAQYNKRLYDDMQNPKVGDLVFEWTTSTSRITPDRALLMVGYLVEIGDWGEYKIKRLDNEQIVEWQNSEFLKIPTEFKA